MKKLTVLLMVLTALLCLYACTPEDTQGTTPPPPQTSHTTVPPKPTTKPTKPQPTTQPTTRPTIPTEPTTQPTEPSAPTQPPTEPHVHSFGPWIMIQRASCTKPEISTHICTCGHTEEKITGQLIDHSYSQEGACIVCGRKVSAGLAYQLNPDGKSYTLISRYECQDVDVIIPEIYQGLPVTAIGYAAFSTSDISSVEMPDSITSIADDAFRDCYRLSSLKLSKQLRTVGSFAFSGTALTEIYLPEHVISIGREALQNCESLRSITVDPYNVAFDDRDGVLFDRDLTKLLVYPPAKDADSYLVPDGVTGIGDYAFLGCYRLKQIQLPQSLVSIGRAAFGGSGIREISIPASVVTIGTGAFGDDRETGLPGYGGCDYLENILVQEGNLYYKSVDGVLMSKDGTRLLVYPAGKISSSYVLPSGVTHVGSYAFMGCTNLRELILCQGLTHIGNNAFGAGFYKSNGLLSISIPDSVEYIGDYALAFCDQLMAIHYEGTLAQWLLILKGQDWNLQTGEYILYTQDPEPPIPTDPEPSLPEPPIPTEPSTQPTEPVIPTESSTHTTVPSIPAEPQLPPDVTPVV